MDRGVERIRRLSERRRSTDPTHEAELEEQELAADRARLAQLEAKIPERLAQLAAASDGDLAVEQSLFRSPGTAAFQACWRSGASDSHAVEIWLHQATGSVEWRWAMGYRQPPIVHRVPASRFSLERLDDLVAGLADPRCWRGGLPPDV
ncbi:MAG: hypothetical protein U0893_10655 [Chloroflexota bacterium]